MTSTARPLVNDKREIFGWAMFDWAISAFSTTVITVFLGPYLSSITKAAADANGMVYLMGVPIRYDSYFTYLISASVLLQVTFLPILGALADSSHLRKRLMQIFSTLGAVATILLFFVTPGLHWLGGLLFLIANLAFGAGMVFYNSYLPNIASEDQRDRVSAYAWAMGYLGGALLLVINLIMYLFAGKIGISEALVARDQPGLRRCVVAGFLVHHLRQAAGTTLPSPASPRRYLFDYRIQAAGTPNWHLYSRRHYSDVAALSHPGAVLAARSRL